MLRYWCVLALSIAAIRGEDLKDIEYGQVAKVSLRMDAHIPDGAGPFAAVILVHGGAWVSGDRTKSVRILFQPLSDAGFAWFSINYRLVGDVVRNPISAAMHFGVAESDVRRAVDFVREHAAEFHVNPGKIALIGESAGGQLASMAALRPDPDGAVQGVVALYTPSDLAMLARNSNLIPDMVKEAVKGTAFDGLLMSALREFSPVNAVSEKAPPFLLIHGTDDDFVPFAQSERFCEKLKASNVSCELYPVKGGLHGMIGWEAMKLTDYKAPMIRWLKQTLAQR